MSVALLGRKIGMTQTYDDQGQVAAVTVVRAGPCAVLQVRTPERDGYHAIQLGFEDVKPHRSNKPQINHTAKVGTGPKRHIRELRLENAPEVAEGDVVTVESFEGGVSYVDVIGTTKGQGFTGVMKRHGFGGQQDSHGVERKHRSPGSIGGHSNIGLGRSIKKGKKMAGHAGHVQRTVKNLRLVSVDRENHLLLIQGSVPGPSGSVVFVQKAKTKA